MNIDALPLCDTINRNHTDMSEGYISMQEVRMSSFYSHDFQKQLNPHQLGTANSQLHIELIAHNSVDFV